MRQPTPVRRLISFRQLRLCGTTAAMSNVRTLVVSVLVVVSCCLLAIACGQPSLPEVDPAYRAEVETWRAWDLAGIDHQQRQILRPASSG